MLSPFLEKPDGVRNGERALAGPEQLRNVLSMEGEDQDPSRREPIAEERDELAPGVSI
jgi:hypothetical protein